jgi:FixJ family two-component response regulator
VSVRRPPFVIAVVDDHQSVLESLESLLQCVGYEVCVFDSGMALLRSGHLADIDCLISDIDLPKIDGFELSRLARAAKLELPVILITGERLPPRGSCDLRVFKKPFDPDELLAAVADAIEQPHRSG